MPRRYAQLSDATWDLGVLHLGEAVGLELGWLAVADLDGPQVRSSWPDTPEERGTCCSCPLRQSWRAADAATYPRDAGDSSIRQVSI